MENEWPQQVYELIKVKQKFAYTDLAMKMGYGPEPSIAFEALTLQKPDLNAALPYEVSRYIRILTVCYSIRKKHFAPRGHEPAFASLPSGQPNALVMTEPRTKIPIIFFERGLFQYFYDYARLVAWSFPPLTGEQIRSTSMLAMLPNRYTRPVESTIYFAALLHNYAASGTPHKKEAPLPNPPNEDLAILILNYMEQFVLAHEIAHVTEDHAQLAKNGLARDALEFEADLIGLKTLSAVVGGEGHCWPLGPWAIDIALAALTILDHSIIILTAGHKRVLWREGTHAQPAIRRAKLRESAISRGPSRLDVSVVEMLYSMTDAVLESLNPFSDFVLRESYSKGIRASPLWREYIEQHYLILTPEEATP